MVADTIGVNKSTARSTVTRYVRKGRIAERPRGGPNHVRVNNEMRDCLNDILNENCLLTLAQINQELRQCLPGKPRIHDRIAASIYSRIKKQTPNSHNHLSFFKLLGIHPAFYGRVENKGIGG